LPLFKPDTSDREWDFNLNIWHDGFAKLTNEKGWVQVEDKLYLLSYEKWVEMPADASDDLIARARSLEVENTVEGVTVTMRDDQTSTQAQGSRFRCSNYGVWGNTPGTTTGLFSNSWLFQDADKPGGNHEWKMEAIYESRRDGFAPFETHVTLKLKYRKRGFLGAWYAYNPRSFSSDGTSDMEANTLQTTSADHDKSGTNTYCCSTWTHYVYSDDNGNNPDTNPPDLDWIPNGEKWDEDCYDFDLMMQVQDSDNVWRTHWAFF
jgi:hypothetical protein